MNRALYILSVINWPSERKKIQNSENSSDSSVSEEIHSTYAFQEHYFKYKEHVSKKKRYQDKRVLFY